MEPPTRSPGGATRCRRAEHVRQQLIYLIASSLKVLQLTTTEVALPKFCRRLQYFLSSEAAGASWRFCNMFDKPALIAKFIGLTVVLIWGEIKFALRAAWVRHRARWLGATAASDRTRNIVIVGASFAGYHVARIVAHSLPPKSPYRVVVVEPNSHFHFTWVLPRFCVVKGHENKAFIPYGGNVAGAPDGVIRWVRDRVESVSPASVRLQESDEEIPYDFLVIATGSKVKGGLPSRVNATDRNEGMKRMRAIQDGIEAAKTVVVVGGGAAGVEVATDAKDLYPDKRIILVHSRSTVMHRFGKILQDAAQKGLERLGVEVILENRVVNEDAEAGTVTLRCGLEIPCDYYLRNGICQINCTGQQPASDVVSGLSEAAISSTGHINVKDTLQIADDDLPNVYACGDVAESEAPNPNARVAMRQAAVVAENILQAARGGRPTHTYKTYWADGVIKLTLGLDRSVSYSGDGVSELMFNGKEKEVTLMAAMAWSRMGQKPYEDNYHEADPEDVEAGKTEGT
ncbi:Putative apoptosis-inducing factor [Tolypocladium paradoxum]|uniref:Apoptosis-inducing factor n=1 Tax=Tolypocladium paradoxum TaxID=94208 RepID=A0A2S4KZF8_9HYPO|nr:Putative apoptosis-inducing factor [Tolypocladium paradoxum]